MAVSDHVVFALLNSVNPALAAAVLSSRPNSRSVADPIVVTDDRSNRRYDSRCQPTAPSFTWSRAAAPKLDAACVLPSRTYVSAAARRIVGAAGASLSASVAATVLSVSPADDRTNDAD